MNSLVIIIQLFWNSRPEVISPYLLKADQTNIIKKDEVINLLVKGIYINKLNSNQVIVRFPIKDTCIIKRFKELSLGFYKPTS